MKTLKVLMMRVTSARAVCFTRLIMRWHIWWSLYPDRNMSPYHNEERWMAIPRGYARSKKWSFSNCGGGDLFSCCKCCTCKLVKQIIVVGPDLILHQSWTMSKISLFCAETNMHKSVKYCWKFQNTILVIISKKLKISKTKLIFSRGAFLSLEVLGWMESLWTVWR